MSDDNLDPKTKTTLNEHIRWVKQATELAISEGAPGIKKAIDEEGDRRARGRAPPRDDLHPHQ